MRRSSTVNCRLVRRAGLGAILIASLSPIVDAQRPAPPPSSTIDPKRTTREQQQREAGLRSAELVVRAVPDTAESKAQLEQVRKDFERLQVLRNEIAQKLVAREKLDYKSMAGKSAEINKRAMRLKSLLLVATDEQSGAASASRPARPAVDDEHLDRALVILCKRIDRFVENPVFDLSGVVDVHQSTKAGSDLLDIIELSESIRKEAERVRRGG